MNQKEELVEFAKKFLGKPYKYGAKPEEAPEFFDCSSFVQYVFKHINIELPRTALEQAHIGVKVENPDTGDLLFFKGIVGRYDEEFPEGIGHVALHIGNNQVIQAKYNEETGGEVRIDSAEEALERKDLIVIKRVI